MDFSYFNNKNKLVKLNITIGTKWNDLKIQNSQINSLFAIVDNGDGIVQENEYQLLTKLYLMADKLIKNISNNKILENSELASLLEKINSKDININNMKEELYNKINYNDYKLESLKKRYPSKDYTITQEDGEIKVLSNKVHQYVLIVISSSETNRMLIKSLANDGYHYEERTYNNGLIMEYDDAKGNYHYPIIENLHNSIKSNDSKKLFKFLNTLSISNIREMLDKYQDVYKNDLIEDIEKIKNENIKNKAKNILTNILSQKYDYKKEPFMIKNSQIKNPHYTGKSYSIKYDIDKITITDKSNKAIKVLDLNKIGKNLTYADKIELKSRLQKMPAEVLIDMAIELDEIRSANSIDKWEKHKNTAAYYSGKENSVILRVGNGADISVETLVHELGHAIDYTGYIKNSATSSSCQNFMQIFQKELSQYKLKGHGQCDGVGDINILFEENYCTTNEKEMFAECYTLLMTGNCQSKATIEKYFKNTLLAAKNMLNDIRKLPEIKRNSVL